MRVPDSNTTAQHSTAQCCNSMRQPDSNTTVQHSTAQHSNTTVSTAVQHSTAHQPPCSPPFLLTLGAQPVWAKCFGFGHQNARRLTNRARQPAPIGVPTPWVIAESVDVHLDLRRVSVLCSPASSSRDRGANPPGDHRESGRPPTCSELACWVRRPHRVVIAVPTRGSALSSSHYRGANPSSSHYRGSTSSSCHYRDTNRGFSRLNWSAQPTLLSLLWYKPWCQSSG